MQTTTFGRLGWTVSVAGLGCGGPSRLGTRQHDDRERAADVVRAAIDAGVTLIDTARGYRTEDVVGAALASRPRAAVRVATKVSPTYRDSEGHEQVRSIADLRADLETSLRALGRERIDLYQLHGVLPEIYPRLHAEVIPALQQWREAGLIDGIGITERFEADRDHRMLTAALRDDCWDSMMVGFNLLNPSAAREILPACHQQGVATLIMFAVRRVFSAPERAAEVVGALIDEGRLPADCVAQIDRNDPFAWLASPTVAASVPAAAYRYVRHQPGCDVILTGTGSTAHLADNLTAIQGSPLPAETLAQLAAWFGTIDHCTGG